MSDQILSQILEKLQSIENKVDVLEKNQSLMQEDIRSIKADTTDIPLIKRAVLETRDDLKELGSSQTKIKSDLNTHDYSIDILNRRQLKLEADLEKLKNK
ncbi:hypothetical protein [Paenibacillus macerans]|uniref:hypothetical protein n=1 Tax=Paenibacillus macerans TaxID=44252 RepID=UPI0020417B8D|nr:hypothetical protein [Paenibacillus macerans]MCM3699251.1 hypothetical protein [Paenibacillus macerans]